MWFLLQNIKPGLKYVFNLKLIIDISKVENIITAELPVTYITKSFYTLVYSSKLVLLLKSPLMYGQFTNMSVTDILNNHVKQAWLLAPDLKEDIFKNQSE